jgi:hypothetical protein
MTTVAIERIVAGQKRSRILSADERRRVAYHEMGHALVAARLPGVHPVHRCQSFRVALGRWATPGSALQRIAFCWRTTTSKTASMC